MGLDRRGFIQFLVGGAVGTLFTPIPWKLTDDISIWTQNWPWIPRNLNGKSEYASTVSKLCPTNCALTVRTVKGHPIRATGNPENPLSGGSISSLAAAEVQMLLSPARLKRPLAKSSDGAFKAISWEQALGMIEEKLAATKGVQDKLAVISGDQNGTINEVLSGFCKLAGSSNCFIMPGAGQNARRAWNATLGNPGQPGYDIENSDHVLAIGADILESWGPAVHTRRAFSMQRPHGSLPKTRYVYAGPVQNNTAAGADEWTPIYPGTEVALAAAVANELINKGHSFPGMEFNAFKDAVAAMSPSKASKITGLPEGKIKVLADELHKAKRPLAIVDSSFTQGAGAAAIIICAGLNLLLNGINNPGGMTVVPDTPKVVDAAMDPAELYGNDLVSFLTSLEKGYKPEMLLVYDANPVYALPETARMTKAFKSLPFKVCFSSFLNETALASDLVLPMPMGLERYDDVVTPYGLGKGFYAPVHPVVKAKARMPLPADILIQLGKELGMDLGYESFKVVLDAKAEALGSSFDDLQGSFAETADLVDLPNPSLKPKLLKAALESMASNRPETSLAPVNRLNYGTANISTPPFNLKTVPDTTLLGDRSFVHLNSATASKLGVGEGDLVKVSSQAGEFQALVHVDEGVMQGVAAAPMNFGHTAFDEFTRGKGGNTTRLMQVASEAGSGLPIWTSTAVKIAKI